MPPGAGDSGPDDVLSGAESAHAAEAAEAAEAEAAEAEARAEAARARAAEIRRRLDESRPDEAAAPAEPAPEAVAGRPRRLLRPAAIKAVAGILAALLVAGLLTATGLMVWKHRQMVEERQRTAEFAAAARQGVVNLMSMDYNQAQESVQRLIDDSTGKFKTNFQDTAEDLIKAMQESKVVTKVVVNDAAVESMTDDSAVVLVAATSQRQGAEVPKDAVAPKVWRVVVSLERDGGQLKMSDVEFA